MALAGSGNCLSCPLPIVISVTNKHQKMLEFIPNLPPAFICTECWRWWYISQLMQFLIHRVVNDDVCSDFYQDCLDNPAPDHERIKPDQPEMSGGQITGGVEKIVA